MTRSRVYVTIAAMAIALAAGGLTARLLLSDEPERPALAATTTLGTPPTNPDLAPSSTSVPPPSTPTSTESPSLSTVPPVIEVRNSPPPTHAEAMSVAAVLAPSIRLPSDCGIPLDVVQSLPNSARDYRAGIHQGIDFICLERGRTATAALPGRVVVAVGDYVDPSPADRSAVLDIAAEAGRTPPWTLSMLYGNFVVLDHGVIDGVGHTVSIYAHLDSVDEAIMPGVAVEAGTPLGEIGNLGTESASTGADNPRSLHLHWELHVDDLYLGAGLSARDTRDVYATLFSKSL